MIFGVPWGLKLPDICLNGEEKNSKPHPGNLSRPVSNSGSLGDRRACCGCSTVVDDDDDDNNNNNINNKNNNNNNNNYYYYY